MKSKKSNKILRNIKIIFYLTIICFSCTYSFIFLIKKNINMNNEMFLELIISGGNYNFLYDYEPMNILNKVVSYFSGIDVNNPTSILNNSLMYSLDNSLVHNDDYSDLEYLESVSFYIKNPSSIVVEEPTVYLYNSHQLENYSSYNFNPYNITPNVMMASYMLQEKLNDYGIPTLVEEADFTKALNEKGYLFYQSYLISKEYMIDAMNKYDGLEYFIDIHRDSVGNAITLLETEDKSYAKVLFVVGLEHDNYTYNLELANALSALINEEVSNLSRGIYKKEGIGVDGVYNQDVSGNVILLEVGGVDSTIEEVNNTLEVVAKVINDYIRR